MLAVPKTLADALLRHGIPQCSACQRRPQTVEQIVDPKTFSTVLRFRCHGSYEEIRIDNRAIADRRLGHEVRRTQHLFAAHASPDVVELLLYNREPWRFT